MQNKVISIFKIVVAIFLYLYLCFRLSQCPLTVGGRVGKGSFTLILSQAAEIFFFHERTRTITNFVLHQLASSSPVVGAFCPSHRLVPKKCVL